MAAAAEILRKGGVLVSEACSACKGVQVKYSGKIICVNCGREEAEVAETTKKVKIGTTEKVTSAAAPGGVITELRSTLTAKINELLPMLRQERDVGRQYELSKLLMSYLQALEKIPELES